MINIKYFIIWKEIKSNKIYTEERINSSMIKPVVNILQ